MDSAIKTFGDDVIGRAQRNLGATRVINGKRRRAVYTGTLKNSLGYLTVTNNKAHKISVRFGVTNPSVQSYAAVVEYGRGKNKKMPPIDAILEYVKKKPIRIRDEKGGFAKSTPSKQRQVAYLIARSIAKKGTTGVYYMRDAVRDSLNDGGDKLLIEATNNYLTEIKLLNSTIIIKAK